MASTRSQQYAVAVRAHVVLGDGRHHSGIGAVMQYTAAQQMMIDDGLPASCILTQAERDEAWAKNPPRAMPAAQQMGRGMSVEDQRIYWSHQLDQIKAKGRVQGIDVARELAHAERELAKLDGDATVPVPAMAAPRAVERPPTASARPQIDAAVKGQPRVRAEPSAMAGASVVKGIDNGGLVTAEDLANEFGLKPKFVRYLLRTFKPVPKPAWGWSFDDTTVEIVRNFLRTKTNSASKPEPAVSREKRNAPAKTSRKAKPKAKSRRRA